MMPDPMYIEPGRNRTSMRQRFLAVGLLMWEATVCSGQHAELLSRPIDTVVAYQVNLSITRIGDSTTYKINGEQVSTEEYWKYGRGIQDKREKCHPCHLRTLTTSGIAVGEGLFYYNCDGSSTDPATGGGYALTKSCPDGEWLFYNKKGKLKKRRCLEMGEKVKCPKV
jgi:hypothetical protein